MNPLYADHNRPVAYVDGRAVDAATFLKAVAGIRARLPGQGPILNLCDDRYRFLAVFVATLHTGRYVVLPPSSAPDALKRLFADTACISDNAAFAGVDGCCADYSAMQSADLPTVPTCPPTDAVAAILHTSGSTGQPARHAKRWGNLWTGAELIGRRFHVDRLTTGTIVATVPAQHMFGLETSIMLPLRWGLAIHHGQPLFPEDMRRALADVPGPRILVTTPLHLRGCLAAKGPFPPIEFVISATAALGPELAAETEARLGCPVYEIYGSTETGAVATRRTVERANWRPLDGVHFVVSGDEACVTGPHLSEPVPLSDRIELADDGGIRLLGRHADLIKVAGKRASLDGLNQQLLQIPGVADGCFVVREGSGDAVRLAALVVAPSTTERDILSALRSRIDPAFMPRPLRRVEHLPRASTGKLPREALLALLKEPSCPKPL